MLLKNIWKLNYSLKCGAAFKSHILETVINVSRIPITSFGARLWSNTFLIEKEIEKKLACGITCVKVLFLNRWKIILIVFYFILYLIVWTQTFDKQVFHGKCLKKVYVQTMYSNNQVKLLCAFLNIQLSCWVL